MRRARSLLGPLSVVVAWSLAAPTVQAATRVETLRDRAARLASRTATLANQLDRRREELAAARERRDRADLAYTQSLRDLGTRLAIIYRTPPRSRLGVVLASPGDAFDNLDLERLVGTADRRLVARYRASATRAAVAAIDIERRRAALLVAGQALDVERLTVNAALTSAAPPAAPTAFAASAIPLSTVKWFGGTLPVAPKPNERGLPADLVTRRALPGTFAAPTRLG